MKGKFVVLVLDEKSPVRAWRELARASSLGEALDAYGRGREIDLPRMVAMVMEERG